MKSFAPLNPWTDPPPALVLALGVSEPISEDQYFVTISFNQSEKTTAPRKANKKINSACLGVGSLSKSWELL